MNEFRDVVLDIAKRSIFDKIKQNQDWLPSLDKPKYQGLTEKQGAFTTLYTMMEDIKALRGCIGYPHPTYPLAHSIALSAKHAAVKDPRFNPVTHQELNELIIEVEILNPIEQLDIKSLDKLEQEIEIGIHGIIVNYQGLRGLLLPKVASRYNWTAEEFLKQTCMKAGLPGSIYKEKELDVFIFTSDLYS